MKWHTNRILKNKTVTIFAVSFLVILFGFVVVKEVNSLGNKVLMKTSMGDITIELNPSAAPITVKNFLSYVDSGFYDDLVFHRVIKGSIIQGGGFDESGIQKKTNKPIKLESNNGLKNNKYTIAMARTSSPDSATSQFFINTNNNLFLDYSVTNSGYTVFGKVVKGKDVVDRIEQVKTTTKNNMQNWPVKNIIIYSIKRI